MSQETSEHTRVRVTKRIEAHNCGFMVTVDPGMYDVVFLYVLLGPAVYTQAFADGHIVYDG